MNSLRLIIVEDEFFAAKHLKRVLEELGHHVVHSFRTAERFLETDLGEFDAAILDIQLAGAANGFAVAEALSKASKPFIFLTANKDQATLIDAVHHKPVSYLSKPFKPNDVSAALALIALTSASRLRIRTASGTGFIEARDILFLKADGSYTEIVTNNGSTLQRKQLKQFEDELPDYFRRVHRSYVVNGKKVLGQTHSHVLVGAHEIPKSRGLKVDLTGL